MSVSDQIDNIEDKLNWHWRDSMKILRFFKFDARAGLVCIPVFFKLFEWRIWLLVIITLYGFNLLEKKGLTFPAAMRNLRAFLVGKERPGLIGVHHRKFKDFG